jgi:hypothetical protein
MKMKRMNMNAQMCTVSGFLTEVHISKEIYGCDFGWEKNQMDVMKFGGITQIDDMAWKKNFRRFFFFFETF